jgi:hypothetical protein
MWWLCLTPWALAGEIVVEAEIPVEVILRGEPAAQIYRSGTVILPAETGDHDLTLFVGGRPQKLVVSVPPDGRAHVIVGRTGITTRASLHAAPAASAPVEVRVTGTESLRLTLAGARIRLGPGEQRSVDLAAGLHPLELRSADGTVVFASGELDVLGTGPVVIHLSEGRAPEVVGSTGAWRPAVR